MADVRVKRARPLPSETVVHRRVLYVWHGERYARSGYRARLLGDYDGPEHFYWTERFGERRDG